VLTGPTPLDDKVLAFGITECAQLAAERVDERPRRDVVAAGER
jgi:hypothetical protein